MKITSVELAKMCGVSRATIDRVFNERGKVQEETKKKIIEIANSVGYRPNYIAKSLATGKTLSIGLVVPDFNNYFFSTLLDAITRKAMENDYIILVSLYENDPEFEKKCIYSLYDRLIDGLILFSTSNDESLKDILNKSKVPNVLLFNEIDDLPCISIDYEKAMIDATQFVLSKGYEHLVFLCPILKYEKDRNISAISSRRDGFIKAIEDRKDITYEVLDNYDYLDKIKNLNKDKNKKTAILCSSDIYVLEILKILKENNVAIPDDIGIMGFDGIDIMKHVEPPISTVEIPISKIGETAIQYLIDIIDTGRSDIELKLPYVIREGESI